MKRYSFLMAAAMLAVIGCEKSPEEINSQKGGEKVYLGFKIANVMTKSQTENDGTSDANPDYEVGFDSENAVNTIDLILTDKLVTIAAQNITAVQAEEGETGRVFVATFESSELTEGANYDVYIYANGSMPASFNVNDSYSTVATPDVTESIAKSNNFLMTSTGTNNKVTISNLKAHTTPANRLDLGTFNVERAAVRFDYQTVNNNVYPIMDGDKVTAKITLTQMGLVNESKSFYDFKRVSPDAEPSTITVGGIETKTNYVVDVDWDSKKTRTAEMYYPFNNANESGYAWTEIPTEGDDNYTPGNYKIWKYATENTIPGVDEQIKGVTTAVAFKGEISPADDAPQALKDVFKTHTAPIFVYGNVLYGTWDMVKAAAESTENPNYTLRQAYDKVEAARSTADFNEVTALASAGFKRFTPKNGKYLTTYYYWNRHNDNGNNAKMGPMEFATVRNNVYKLSVTNINLFGHPYQDDPKNPDPDPDPETPEQPDESVEYYFTVSVKVLPWTVRINNIEF